jgi:hypothetical protein
MGMVVGTWIGEVVVHGWLDGGWLVDDRMKEKEFNSVVFITSVCTPRWLTSIAGENWWAGSMNGYSEVRLSLVSHCHVWGELSTLVWLGRVVMAVIQRGFVDALAAIKCAGTCKARALAYAGLTSDI